VLQRQTPSQDDPRAHDNCDTQKQAQGGAAKAAAAPAAPKAAAAKPKTEGEGENEGADDGEDDVAEEEEEAAPAAAPDTFQIKEGTIVKLVGLGAETTRELLRVRRALVAVQLASAADHTGDRRTRSSRLAQSSLWTLPKARTLALCASPTVWRRPRWPS
jgi:hypothetical protein